MIIANEDQGLRSRKIAHDELNDAMLITTVLRQA
jgi:hypothetical protein